MQDLRRWLRYALLLVLSCPAAAMEPGKVPEALRPWTDWVLHEAKDKDCPFLYNEHATRRCDWPAQLDLDLAEQGGSFDQRWRVYREGWVALPGNTKHWPQEVTVDGAAATVIERDGRPLVRLLPGEHLLSGRFQWPRLPEALMVPPDTGLIALKLAGVPVSAIDLRTDGELWLRAGSGTRAVEEQRLEVRVFRRLIDELPMQVLTRITLGVAGEQRELVLPEALLAGTIPMSLASPLPARVESDGRLRMQIRPGEWVLDLNARFPAEVLELQRSAAAAPWPKDEIWVFDARNHLRLVEVSGVDAIDPRQTSLPEDWQQFPSYRLRPGDKLDFKVIRHGDPEPEPDRLELSRNIWLDFDGGGYTVQDRLRGTLTQQWRLEADAGLMLGRVVVDGVPQFITRLPGSRRQGVEVRRGSLQLSADSRIEGGVARWPAVGWAHDVHLLNASLHLPPGWRLLYAGGSDDASDTWLQAWTLLDLFLVFIGAVATARLWRWTWGILALLTLALVWLEPGAPQLVWLNLLAATALLRVLPEGRLRSWIASYRLLSLLGLLLIAIPFAIQQVRIGLYPQLEEQYGAVAGGGVAAVSDSVSVVQPTRTMEMAAVEAPLPAAPPASAAPEAKKAEAGKTLARGRAVLSGALDLSSSEGLELDPKAMVQTGPGVPEWQWRRVDLSWRGPVEQAQEVALVYLSPPINLLLCLLRVLLVAVFALRMTDALRARNGGGQAGAATLSVLLVLTGIGLPGGEAHADFPSAKLRAELKQRLLEPPECLPVCAQIARARVDLDAARLQLRLEIHSAAEVALPLPAARDQWLPALVTVDGGPASGLSRAPSGELWLTLSPGLHQVQLMGSAPARTRFQLPFPLLPHRVEVSVRGWRLDGLPETGVPEGPIQFTRLSEGAVETVLSAGPLPAFLRVERVLRLGLEWRVETTVQRLTPPGNPVLVSVPLLAGESVVSEGVEVKDGAVLVNMSSDQTAWAWQSVLEKREAITLTAPRTSEWSETWRADISPVWHLEARGIAVVHHQDPHGRWLPEWRPWPGEAVTLALSRPAGIQGNVLTIQNSRLSVSIGQRASDAVLDLKLESSQGGQHSLRLPAAAKLQQVTLGGVVQPVRQQGRQVILPLVPGTQLAQLRWRSPDGIDSRYRSPEVHLGAPSVNHSLNLTLGDDRWVLHTGGPLLGPAVLFWGILLVIALIAMALGRVRLTPLGFGQWFLLGVGLSQAPVWGGLLVVGWLLALGARAHVPAHWGKTRFNTMQLGLGLLTVVAIIVLFTAIHEGLLGWPEMQIAGNGSSAYALNWYQDRNPAELPRAWVVSVPLWVYRLLMLTWALWLAFALLRWLRWGWDCYSAQGLWKPLGQTLARPGAA
ncbi:MAG: hypothetical protein ACREWG_16050 [Gammaproteobacteria bacterium]